MTRAAAVEGFRFVSLLDVFDATPEETFIDFAHLTPAGNAIIAERAFQVLACALQGGHPAAPAAGPRPGGI